MVDAMVDAVLDTMVDAMVDAVLDTMVDEMVDAIVEESVRNIMAKMRYSTPFTTRLGGGGRPCQCRTCCVKTLGGRKIGAVLRSEKKPVPWREPVGMIHLCGFGFFGQVAELRTTSPKIASGRPTYHSNLHGAVIKQLQV